MASPGNRHCAKCISAHRFRSRFRNWLAVILCARARVKEGSNHSHPNELNWTERFSSAAVNTPLSRVHIAANWSRVARWSYLKQVIAPGRRDDMPPPMAVRLAAAVRPSADRSAVQTWLYSLGGAGTDRRTDGRTDRSISLMLPFGGA